MKLLVVLPLIAFVVFALRRGARQALVKVTIPALLLLPAYYGWKLPGVPELTFHNYLLLATAAALLMGRDRARFRLHPLDALPPLYVALTVHSEAVNKDLHEARNLFASQLMLVVAPWVIGRVVAQRNGWLVGVIAALVVVGAAIGWASPFEARMGSNPFDEWLRSRWPNHVPWDGALYRAGIRRVAGPFAHPICHGFFFSMSIPLLLWMRDRRLAPGRLPGLVLLFGHVLGLLTSVSRGPILGLLGALLITRIGWMRERAVVSLGCFVCATGLAFVSYGELHDYVTVTRATARTESQETAAYRNEMLENYMEVVEERPWVGFGRYQLPVVKGQKSIDNQYLFVTLTHGLPSAIVFLAFMLLPAGFVAFRSLGRPHDDPLARLGLALAGLLCGAVFTQITVFSGAQTAQVLLLIGGVAVTLGTRLRPGMSA